MEHELSGSMVGLMKTFEGLGVFLAMFLESSIVPIPSEAVVIAAGAIGIPVFSIVVFGSLGSAAGAVIGYSLGRYAALPVILKFGKFVLIKPHHIYKAEAFARKHGAAGVLIGRVLPIVPFKVFSIAAGITNIPFIPFFLCTLIGVVPRMYILAVFGSAVVRYKKPALLFLLAIALALAAYWLTKSIYNKPKP